MEVCPAFSWAIPNEGGAIEGFVIVTFVAVAIIVVTFAG